MDDLAIPIDIHYNKLLDWLVDRRHCNVKWHQQLRQIRENIVQHLTVLPENTIEAVSELKDNEIVDVTYFDCHRILEYLKTVEPLDTNFLGQYTSQPLKDWSEILKSYEKNNIHLAEGAQMLTRQVNYEIASLKRQVTKCQQQQREYSKRANDCQQSANNHKHKFEEQCKELGIKGVDVHSELVQLVEVLPAMFIELVTAISETSKSVQFYKAFCNSINKRNVSTADIVPLLTCVINNGNVTVYEFERGEPPNEVTVTHRDNCTKVDSASATEQTTDDIIDWGDIVGEDSVSQKQDDEIDFDNEDIDFDIITVEDIDVSQIVIEGTGETVPTNGRVTLNKSQYPTILEDFDYRNRLMNDIMEVYEFLKQRDIELTAEESTGMLMISTQLPEILQVNSSEDLVTMMTSMRSVIEKMTDKKMQHLLLIVDSQSYLERLSSQLLHEKQRSQQLLVEIDDYTHKAEESNSHQYLLEEKMSLRVKRTKEFQKKIASEISKKYKGRKVNIIGEINQI